MESNYKIINLAVENVKRIKVVQITPDGNTVIIGGKNGNGKSSTLDAIAMALGGKKLIPNKPVRDGEETAKIELDIGDYIITRHWTNPETSYLKLVTKDGGKITNAQKILDNIVGNLSFDPLEFATMEPSKQFDMLREITGLDFSELDKEFASVYQDRRDVNRDGQKIKTRLDTEFQSIDENMEINDIDDVKKEKAEAQQFNQNLEEQKNEVDKLAQQIDTNLKYQEQLEEDLKIISQKLENAKESHKILKEQFEDHPYDSRIQPKDLSEFDKKLESWFELKAIYDKAQVKKEVLKDRDITRDKYKKLDDRLKEIDATKAKMISEADLPIEGISFGNKEVLFKGIPFNQLSTSEQIRISMSIAISQNPKLKIAIIKNGSLLDSDAMKEIKAISEEKDFQIWIEKVSDGPEAGQIYIEDGAVANG